MLGVNWLEDSKTSMIVVFVPPHAVDTYPIRGSISIHRAWQVAQVPSQRSQPVPLRKNTVTHVMVGSMC